MKHRLFGFFILILSLSRVFANDTSSIRPVLKPIGFANGDNFLLGFIGGESIIEYETPSIKIEKSPNILSSLGINYGELLLSGIKSLLFEYKNYRGGNHLSSYSVFANGNYSVIDERLLRLANKYFFKNRKFLNQLYDWALPSYRQAFQLLTYEEQYIQKRNIEVAEKYIELVLTGKNRKAFSTWLLNKGFEHDEKITGFLKRRIIKRQWTIDDCQYWVGRIKRDFIPLMKDPEQHSSHYQIIEQVNEKLYKAVDGKGYCFMVNNQFKPLTYGYAYIMTKGDSLIMMRYEDEDNSIIYSIRAYNKKGYFDLLPFPEWNSYSPITDSSGIFTSTEMSGIYDIKNKRYILDTCSFIRSVAHSPYVIAVKKIWYCYGTDTHEPTRYLLYNFNGQKLTDETVFVEMASGDESNEMICIYNVSTSSDGKMIAFMNGEKKVGIIDSSGNTVVPFKYEWVDLNEYPRRVLCGLSSTDRKADVYSFE